MNGAHLHLILNHLPLFTIPVALIFLVYALWRKDQGLKRFSLIVLILTSLMVLPVYLTGEPAEEVIEHLSGVSEALIEAHEEAAEFSLVVTLAAGVLSLAALFFVNHVKLNRVLPGAVVLVCLVAIASLGYTANLGGKIRHPETSVSHTQSPME